MGALKTNTDDCRNVLERASARETAARVAATGVAREFLAELGVEVFSYVVSIGDVELCEDDALLAAPDYKPLDIEMSEVRCPEPATTEAMKKAIDAVNIIAPEHLEICVDDPFAVLNDIQNAGSIFLGKNVPEALGDYFAGPNHTLPPSGTARFSSPLGVDDFVKKSSFIYYTREALGEVQARIANFAEHEGLHAHAKSVTIRFEDEQKGE